MDYERKTFHGLTRKKEEDKVKTTGGQNIIAVARKDDENKRGVVM